MLLPSTNAEVQPLFGRSLETILPKLKHGYLVPNAAEAQRLANEHIYAFFLTPEGECFHNATVTGGKPSSEGPLALKRELREIDAKLAGLEAHLGKAETEAATLARRNKSYAGAPDVKLLKEPEEKSLAEAINIAKKDASATVASENFAAAMTAMAKLRPKVDAFFDKVTVNVDDKSLRENRLKLLNEIREATRAVADFSRIEG